MIIGLSGKISSGKSTVADFLVTKYGFKILSTRKLLTSILNSKNLEANRKNLQQMGKDLVSVIGAGGFIAIMLEYLPSGNYVLDSIRYTGALNYLRKKYGSEYCHIHIISNDDLRYLRMKEKSDLGDSIDNMRIREMAETELGNEELGNQADFHVTNEGSFEDLYSQLNQICQQIL